MSDQQRGLSSPQADESRRLHGSNILTPPQKQSLWKAFLAKFKDPLIIILLVAGVLSVGISCYEYLCLDSGPAAFFEPLGIFMAIILATGLAFFFELKAEREFEILNKVDDDAPVMVIRDGAPRSIPRRDVVVGDVVIFDTGSEIPADGRLIEAVALSIDESSLTGEPLCHKSIDPTQADTDATFPSDFVLRGTKVMEGHGVMLVTAVGDNTENGKVFTASTIDSSVRTPLDEQLSRLGRVISIASYTIATLVVVARLVMYWISTDFSLIGFIAYMLQTFMIAVALVVVSVPEGLPMAVTLSLAYSMRRMLRTNNLVRRLHACETMGATTVICTDKTGTLTQNRMQVADMQFFGNPSDTVIAEAIAVNSTARLDPSTSRPSVLGNPTEGALLLWLLDRGTDYDTVRAAAQVVAEQPFSTERKYMATLVRSASRAYILYVKGAPEIVYGMCSDTAGVSRDEFDACMQRYQSQAMRTIAFAYRELPEGENPIAAPSNHPSGLTFLGVAAISDPVRPDVPAAVGSVLRAGIDVKVVTGDTPATAKEIARQIGLWNDDAAPSTAITTGPEVAAMTDAELQSRAPGLKIIARARPMDKKRLVEALQADGQVVAVTGDGTNDAPALKAAQVGLSMGDGTSVAKEASDITIIDNSFASIGMAVMWGRSLYRNIQRFILFQMTVNVAACLIVLFGSFVGLQSPLTVTQMLWVNLIMDTFAAMALASLPPTAAVMDEAPRSRSAFIISPAMWRFICGVGGLFFVALAMLLFYLEHTDLTSLLQIGSLQWQQQASLTPYELSLFFTVFVFLQFWNMFNARAFATGRSAFHFGGCTEFLLIAAVIFFGQVAIVTLGGEFFSVEPLRFSDWIISAAATSSVLWIGELCRLFKE